MKGLIIKDLLQLKSYAKTIIIFSIIFILTSLNSEDANAMEMLILMMTLGFGMLGIASFSYDELAKANKYIITFPITKKEIVLSKYILEFMLLLIGAILGICLSFTISIILNKEQIEFMEMISVASGGILGVALVESIQTPCVYKLGAEKGRIYMFIITMVTAFLAGGIIMFGEKIALNYSINLGVLQNIMENYFPIIMIFITFIVYYISYKISYKIYNNKEF